MTGVPTGDFTADGVVDARDYVRWRNKVGILFQQSDFDLWRSHFGQTVGSEALSDTTIPESNLLLLLGALSSIVGARRQAKWNVNRRQKIDDYRLEPLSTRQAAKSRCSTCFSDFA